MTKDEKQQVVAEVTETLKDAGSLFLTDFTGLNVESTNAMRAKFREAGIPYMVVKNTLVKRSLENLGGYDALYDYLKNSTAIAVGNQDDPIAPARVIKEVTKKSDFFKMKAAMVEGKLFEDDKLDYLAKLPTKEELIAQAMGSIMAPAQNLVGVMAAVMRNLMYAINQVSEKQKN